jgi:hypothetical protein
MTTAMLKEIFAFPCAFAADLMAVCSSMASYLSTVATNMVPHLRMLMNLYAFILFPGDHDVAIIACYTGDESFCVPLQYYVDPDYDWDWQIHDRAQLTKTELRYFYYLLVMVRIAIFVASVLAVRLFYKIYKIYKIYKAPPFDEADEIEPSYEEEDETEPLSDEENEMERRFVKEKQP